MRIKSYTKKNMFIMTKMYRNFPNQCCDTLYDCSIKLRRCAIAILFVLGGTQSVSAQWNFGLYTHSNSVITKDVLACISILTNSAIARATYGMTTGDFILYNYHYVDMKDNGERIAVRQNNPYSFKLYDLLNDVEAGIKIGWLSSKSPIGVYLYGAYGINQYDLRFLGERDYSRHTLQSIRAGIGARISPFRFLKSRIGFCPIFEIGSTYINNFYYKGPNGNDKDQINNGIRSSYAVGILFGKGTSVTLRMDMAHFDIFNRDYTPDGGFWFPYANFKSKDMNFSLAVTLSIFND